MGAPLINFDGMLIDAAGQLVDLSRFDCEESLYRFTKSAWGQIDPAPFRDGWPIEAVCEHLEAVVDGDIKRLIINIPPRSRQTTLCSVCFPAWVWAQPERDSHHQRARRAVRLRQLRREAGAALRLRNRRLIQSQVVPAALGRSLPPAQPTRTPPTASSTTHGRRALVTSINGHRHRLRRQHLRHRRRQRRQRGLLGSRHPGGHRLVGPDRLDAPQRPRRRRLHHHPAAAGRERPHRPRPGAADRRLGPLDAADALRSRPGGARPASAGPTPRTHEGDAAVARALPRQARSRSWSRRWARSAPPGNWSRAPSRRAAASSNTPGGTPGSAPDLPADGLHPGQPRHGVHREDRERLQRHDGLGGVHLRGAGGARPHHRGRRAADVPRRAQLRPRRAPG